MADPAFIVSLGSELTADPEAIGYSAPPAQWDDYAVALVDFNLMTAVNVTSDVATLSGSQLFEAIDDTEWQTLTVDAKSDIQFVVSLGDNIQISPGTKARTMLARALSGQTNSLANLAALGSKLISRAEELGFSGLKVGHIQLARRDAP